MSYFEVTQSQCFATVQLLYAAFFRKSALLTIVNTQDMSIGLFLFVPQSWIDARINMIETSNNGKKKQNILMRGLIKGSVYLRVALTGK